MDIPVYDPPGPYDPPTPVVVVPAEPEMEEEIDSALELQAAEAIVNEERHEEIIECLKTLEVSSSRQGEALQSLSSHQAESPLLLQISTQQTEILGQLSALNQTLSSASPPRTPSSNESTPEPKPGKTEESTAAPLEENPPPAPPKKRRFRTV